MNEHLSETTLSALADGELSQAEMVRVNEHLAGCAACTSAALAESLLKRATARAGMRYAAPDGLLGRVASAGSARSFAGYGWMAAAAILLIGLSFFMVERRAADAEVAAEVVDQHIAVLAGNAPPEVVSSDRHTVKPWFQGRIPFSFNLPQNLPVDVTLDGANLTYLRGQPTAQLLYSIGKHRVSVFVQQRGGGRMHEGQMERAGFRVSGFSTQGLQVEAVSDVDPARLAELAGLIEQAQK